MPGATGAGGPARELPERTTGTSGADDAERRRALRRVARQYHPDVGGDPETYLRAVAAIEARWPRRTIGQLPGGRAWVQPVEVQRAVVWRQRARRLRRRLWAWRLDRRTRRRQKVDLSSRAGRR